MQGSKRMRLMDSPCSSKSKWTLMGPSCKGKPILNLMNSCSRSSKARLELMELPTSILVDIFLKLPVKSVCIIESVSKTLFNIIRGDFRAAQLMHLLAPSNETAAAPDVWLFSRAYTPVPPTERAEMLMTLQSLKYDGSNAFKKFKYSFEFSQLLSTSDRYLKKVYRVHFVFRSYLIFLQHKHDLGRCFLVNCSSGVVLKLPTNFLQTKYGPALHTAYSEYEWYGMGFDNITGSHKVVRVVSYGEYPQKVFFAAEVLVLGANSWREISSVPPSELFCKKGLCAYGDMHWLNQGSSSKFGIHLVSFDFNKEEFRWDPHPTLGNRFVFKLHLIAFRGSMAIVDTSSDQKIDVWVLKNRDKNEWALDYSVNLRMFRYCNGLVYACGEWEHGIIINKVANHIIIRPPVFCLDLRCGGSMKRVEYPLLYTLYGEEDEYTTMVGLGV